MLCYWFTSNAFSLVQVLFLKIPAVRHFFKIPELVSHETAAPLRKYDVQKKGFVEGVQECKQFALLCVYVPHNLVKVCYFSNSGMC